MKGRTATMKARTERLDLGVRQQLRRYRQHKRQVDEDLDQRDLAVRRLGATPGERLRWVLAFAEKDLADLRPEERVALGYDLRALTPPVGTITRSAHQPILDAVLQRIQAEVKASLRRLLSMTLPHPAAEGGWALSPPERIRVVPLRTSDGGRVFMRVEERREEAGSILAAVAGLLIQAGADLRTCPECGTPFVRTRRQKFCGEKCSMRVRNRKRPKKSKRGA